MQDVQANGYLSQPKGEQDTLLADRVARSDLYHVNGPNGDLYGFLFTGWSYMVVKPVNDHTLRAFGLRGPPEYTDVYPGGR